MHSHRTHGKDTSVPKPWTHKSEIEPEMATHTVAIIRKYHNGDADGDDGDDANDSWIVR